MDALLLTKLIAGFLLPPVGLLLLLLLGLCLRPRWPRLGTTLTAGSIAAFYLLATAPVATALLAGLESQPALTPGTLAAVEADAVVVLGGGRRDFAPEYGGETVSSETLERIRYGARVHRGTGLPVAVTGGTVFGEGTPEAHLMAQALAEDFSTPVRWVEDRSRNTEENAAFTHRLLHEAGITRIVLVSHAAHLSRAVPMFRARGFEVVPAPTAFFSDPDGSVDAWDWLPTMGALRASSFALHERLGRVWYRLRHGLAVAAGPAA